MKAKELLFTILTAVIMLPGYAASGDNLFPDPTFRSWAASAEREFGVNAGENGSPGLIVQRKDKDVFDYKYETVKVPLKPNTRYEIIYRVRGEKISHLKLGAGVRLEFRYKGKWTGAFMRRNKETGTFPWHTVRYEFTTPKQLDTTYIGFFLGMPFKQPANELGYAVFCSPILRELKPVWQIDLLNPVLRHGLKTGKHALVFASAFIGDVAAKDPAVQVKCTGATEFEMSVPMENDRFVIEADWQPGESTLHFTYSGISKKFNISAGNPMPENGVWIDEKGRMIRNGKPYLPVAIYDNHYTPPLEKYGWVITDEDLKLFCESPFNVYSLGSIWWTRFEGEESNEKWGEITQKHVDNALKLMDILHASGKTVMFCAKPLHKKSKMLDALGETEVIKFMVKTYAAHPAMLMWYLNDETDLSEYELYKRELFAKLDPFHPTIQAQYKIDAYNECIGGADIMAMDNYPIYNAESDLEIIAKSMDALHRRFGVNGHISCWSLPQIFNWNNYSKTVPWYFPKEEQIRGNLILMALSGIKGFYFYSRQWLREGVDHAGYLKRWEMVCRQAQMLRDLEAYLLSDQEHPEFEMKVIKGHVRAQTFKTNDGKTALLIANVGKGEGVAEITFPEGKNLKSCYGLTGFENGKWVFRGKNATGDIVK